jgi:2-desacetyl-2-hydroxyethyl bacteriochlorophyllide A dehydrogenase
MRAVYYQLVGPGDVRRVETTLDPEALGPADVLAETEYSVVSPGTELAAWEGQPPLRPSRAYPRLMGYCNLARVVAIGTAVDYVAAGDWILTNQSHRTAFVCGQSDILLRVTTSDDLLRRRLTATYLYQLGHTALHAGGFAPGTEIGIVGLGTLGFTTASLAIAGGTLPWIFSNQDRPTLERLLPNAHVRTKKESLANGTESVATLGGLDLVINTSNLWADHLLAMQLARKGGTIVMLGFPGRGQALPDFNPLDSQYMYDKQLTLRHCGHVTHAELPPIDVRLTLRRSLLYLSDLIRRGVLDPGKILSLEAPADDLAEVYRRLARRSAGVYTALLRWRG